MRSRSLLFPVMSGGIIAFAASASAVRPTLRWASTGGGWRAQFACVGFARLFSRLGVLHDFGAVSTTSGASWFSTQLFYSREFHDAVARAEDSGELYDFVLNWMDAYRQILEEAIAEGRATIERNETELDRLCGNLDEMEPTEGTESLRDLCGTIVYFDGDWARFVDEMLEAASAAYGDAGFSMRAAGRDGRLEELSGTDLLIQSAFVPNFRIRGAHSDTAVYVGPRSGEIYTVPISAAYVVNASGTAYQYDNSRSEMIVRTSRISSRLKFEDWEDFYLYPGTNGTVEIGAKGDTMRSGDEGSYSSVTRRVEGAGDGTFSPPFGGGDSTVAQVAAISSAALGTKSPAVPSVFTQDLSRRRYTLENAARGPARNGGGKLRAFDRTAAAIYGQSILDKVAVCSQWPAPCGPADGLFVDGWIADNPAFAINVGQYHIAGGDLDETLRVILTNTNTGWPEEGEESFQFTQVLQYFESPLNEGVEVGGFNWPPGMFVPYQSPQIFADFMDAPGLDHLIEPIAGSNMTTALLKGTTIDNPVYGVRAGQPVEIFVINLNEPITTYVATPELVDMYAVPLAEMTRRIADDEELARRIEDFVAPLSTGGKGGDRGGGGGGKHLPLNGAPTVDGNFSTAAAVLTVGLLFLSGLNAI